MQAVKTPRLHSAIATAAPTAAPTTAAANSDLSRPGESARPATLRLDLRSRPSTLEALNASPSRDMLERELDRVQSAVQASEATFAQQLSWLLLAQALFLNAYLVVLVFSTSLTLPGRGGLLAGLAIFAAVFAAFSCLSLRGSRDAARTLRMTRSELEAKLAKQGRTPVFAHQRVISARRSALTAHVLPAAFIVGWLMISIYALAGGHTAKDAVPPHSSVLKANPAAAAAAARAAAVVPAPIAPAAATPAFPVRNAASRSVVPAAAATAAEPSSSRAVPSNTAAEAEEPRRHTGFKW